MIVFGFLDHLLAGMALLKNRPEAFNMGASCLE